MVWKTIDSPNPNKTNNEPQLWNNRASGQQDQIRGSKEVLANIHYRPYVFSPFNTFLYKTYKEISGGVYQTT